jgi:hypothetical protein
VLFPGRDRARSAPPTATVDPPIALSSEAPLVGVYAPRRVEYCGLRSVAGWQLKTYGLSREGAVSPELYEAMLGRAEGVLPQPAQADDRYGVGFAIAHQGDGIAFALIYWWQAANELHQRVFVSRPPKLGELAPVANPAAGCVHEIAIISFESQAWIEEVIGNTEGADIARYLARHDRGVA